MANFAMQFCGHLVPEVIRLQVETEVEKFGCLQPLKKMLKLRGPGAVTERAGCLIEVISMFEA